MSVNTSVLRDDEKAYFNWILHNTVSKPSKCETTQYRIFRITIDSCAFTLGLVGNYPYFPYSVRFAERLDVPSWFNSILGNYLGISNVATNGILTAVPLTELTNDLLKKRSKVELEIYRSEIPAKTRAIFLGSSLVLAIGSQIPTAYLAYLPKNSLANGFVLVASNMGLPWKSLYQLMCSTYLLRRLSPREMRIEDAKAAFIKHITVIKTKIINNDLNSIGLLFNAIAKDETIMDDEKVMALRELYNFPSPRIEGSLNYSDSNGYKLDLKKLFVHAVSTYLTFWLLSLYWIGGGKAGEDMITSLANKHDLTTKKSSYYAFSSFSTFCNSYLCAQYVNGTVKGIFSTIVDLVYGTSSRSISATLYPKMTMAWKVSATILTLGSWAFSAEYIISDYPENLKLPALFSSPAGVMALLGYGMFQITDAVVIFLMNQFSTVEEKKIIVAHEKLTRLQEITAIASHKVFAEHLKRVFEIFEIEEKFGLTKDDLKAYFASLSSNETIPLLELV